MKPLLIYLLLAGETEGPEQAGPPPAGRHQGLGPAAGREDEGDPEDLAALHGQEVGGLAQRVHAGLRGLPGPVLQCPDH